MKGSSGLLVGRRQVAACGTFWHPRPLCCCAQVALRPSGFAPRGGFQIHIRRGHAVFPSGGLALQQREGASPLQSTGAGLTSEAFLGVT